MWWADGVLLIWGGGLRPICPIVTQPTTHDVDLGKKKKKERNKSHSLGEVACEKEQGAQTFGSFPLRSKKKRGQFTQLHGMLRSLASPGGLVSAIRSFLFGVHLAPYWLVVNGGARQGGEGEHEA